jgi:hypothetical protein
VRTYSFKEIVAVTVTVTVTVTVIETVIYMCYSSVSG